MKKISWFAAGALFGILIMLSSTALGAEVLQSITATFNSSLKVSLDGKQVELKQGALNYNDTNYLSVREVAAATGLDVNWNDSTQTVELSSKVVAPSPSPNGSVGTGGDSMSNETTSEGFVRVYIDGKPYIKIIDIVRKYDGMGYNFSVDTSKGLIYLKYNDQPGHPVDKYQVISDGINYKIYNNETCIEESGYDSVVKPLLK